MKDSMNRIIWAMIAMALIAGFLFGKGCQEKGYKSILRRDTIEKVRIQPREVFVKPDVRIKSIMVPYHDTMYVKEQLPCDSAFIAQADSVITTTGDTINVAFSHNPLSESFFHMVVKPRPDSIIFREIIVEKVKTEDRTDFGWIVASLVTGIAIGILGTR
jgi:hypothetical protein